MSADPSPEPKVGDLMSELANIGHPEFGAPTSPISVFLNPPLLLGRVKPSKSFKLTVRRITLVLFDEHYYKL